MNRVPADYSAAPRDVQSIWILVITHISLVNSQQNARIPQRMQLAGPVLLSNDEQLPALLPVAGSSRPHQSAQKPWVQGKLLLSSSLSPARDFVG